MKLRHGAIGLAIFVALAGGGIASAIGADGEGSDGPLDNQSEAFLGLTTSDAIALADGQDRPWRISREDDETFVLTDDLVPGRVTFEIDKGSVTHATIEQPNTTSPDVVAEDPIRAALIANALERLVTVDNGFRDVDVFDDIRVANVIGADPSKPLHGLELETIASALSDVGAVRYIDDAEAEISTLFEASPAGVAVVSIEDVLILDDRAEIEMRLWCGSLCGVYLTYEATLQNGLWEITGTVGPISMS